MKKETIYFSELAQRYFPRSNPKSALIQFRRWIVLNPALTARLEELYFSRYQRALTPKQYDAIVDTLGEP